MFQKSQSINTKVRPKPEYASVVEPVRSTKADATTIPEIRMPKAKVLLARVNCWTRLSK